MQTPQPGSAEYTMMNEALRNLHLPTPMLVTSTRTPLPRDIDLFAVENNQKRGGRDRTKDQIARRAARKQERKRRAQGRR